MFNTNINDLFHELFFGWVEDSNKPPIDNFPIYEGDNITQWCIQLAVAGFNKSDISVVANGNYLIISGDNRYTGDPFRSVKNITIRKDISPKFTCSFRRKIRLSERLDIQEALVSFHNGLLNIQIPLKDRIKPKEKILFGSKK
jgi:HSP20 family molecular chaperone IbpA